MLAKGERRRIVWNDETGEVSGDHGDLPRLRAMMAAGAREKRLIHWANAGYWDFRDPLRDPADFLACLRETTTPLYDADGLPAALRGVEPTPLHANGIENGEIP